MSSVTAEYGSLLRRFLDNEVTASEFQSTYLERFKNETQPLDEAVFQILDGLFGDLDSFEPDAETRAELNAEQPGFYIDEPTLRDRVARARDALAALGG